MTYKTFSEIIHDNGFTTHDDLATLIVSNPDFTVKEFLDVDVNYQIKRYDLDRRIVPLKYLIQFLDEKTTLTNAEKAAVITVIILSEMGYPIMQFYEELERCGY